LHRLDDLQLELAAVRFLGHGAPPCVLVKQFTPAGRSPVQPGPVRGVQSTCPLAISHSRAVPYSPPVRTSLPSAEKDTARIASVCPPKICNCWPVDRSQRRVVVSAPAVSACLPSGEKATTYIASVWPIKRRKLKGAREGAAQCIDRLRVVAILQTADSEQSRQLTSCT